MEHSNGFTIDRAQTQDHGVILLKIQLNLTNLFSCFFVPFSIFHFLFSSNFQYNFYFC